jgi:hypothetical protein
MAAAGDVDTWTRMVRAALGEAAPLAETAGKGTGEIYQKPWG